MLIRLNYQLYPFSHRASSIYFKHLKDRDKNPQISRKAIDPHDQLTINN